MKFKDYKDYKDKKIAAEEIASHAECLAAMDCLMHHMNGEYEIACWLQGGVPDSDNWGPFGDTRSKPADRRDYYEGLARGMTYGEYEACVRIFVYAVRAQCFATKYTPRSFT